jgi:hypothetical protein
MTEHESWKGLDPVVLDAAGVVVTKNGLVHIPCRAFDGRTLRTRIAAPSGRRWWADDGEGIHLFGVETLAGADPSTPVLVCEGESDALAAREHLPGVIALGSPGARTFRPEWRALIEDFPLVYAVGDGDHAGVAFAWSLRRAVPWSRPIVCPEGRDLRDLLQGDEREFVLDLLDAADAWARIEHAVLHAADVEECALWLREGIPA